MPQQAQIPSLQKVTGEQSLDMEVVTVGAVEARAGLRSFDGRHDHILEQSFRLRHCYFVQERGWVAEDPRSPGRETDRYDEQAVHFALTSGPDVTAYLRALPFDPSLGFMLDNELSAILSPSERRNLRREGALELSRLVCGPRKCGSRTKERHPLEVLLKSLYRFSKARDFRTFYVVVEPSWLKPFERHFGLPFRIVGNPYTFPDGTTTVAAVASLHELEDGMLRHSLEKFTWYQTETEEPKAKNRP